MTTTTAGKDVAIDLAGLTDPAIRLVAEAIRNFLRDHPLTGFSGKLLTLTVTNDIAGAWTLLPHQLGFQPKDVLVLSVQTTRLASESSDPTLATVSFDPRYHTSSNLYLNASHASVIRVLVGTFGG